MFNLDEDSIILLSKLIEQFTSLKENRGSYQKQKANNCKAIMDFHELKGEPGYLKYWELEQYF